jgi:hypothetical protein
MISNPEVNSAPKSALRFGTNRKTAIGLQKYDCRRFCAEKASAFNKSQQLSTGGPQQVQYQSFKNLKFQQISISYGIWFGTRGSEVQILSPQPFKPSEIIELANCRFPV